MNQENLTKEVVEEVKEVNEEKVVIDYDKEAEVLQKAAEEAVRKVEDKSLLEMAKHLGIKEEVFKIKPDIMEIIDDTINIVRYGNEEQRRNGLIFFEVLERIGIVRMGTSLTIKDAFVLYNKELFDRPLKTKEKKGITLGAPYTVGMPEPGLTKEEFENVVSEQILRQCEDASDELIKNTIDIMWDIYKEIGSEENKNN